MDKTILEKIKKCLALSKSDNENEAAVALKLARKLMDKYNVNADELAFSDIKEYKSRPTKTSPPAWASQLSNAIAEAFGCRVFINRGIDEDYNASFEIVFIGLKSNAYLARYAYEVLYRQLKKSRRDYYAKNNKRCKRATRIVRADLFAQGYVCRLYKKVQAFAGECAEIIDEYMSVKHPTLKEYKPRVKKSANNGRAWQGDNNAFDQGLKAGADASLLRPVGGHQQKRLGD